MCVIIFFARIVDVCMGTFRTVCIVKGKKVTAATIAFFEVLVWFFVAREALTGDIDSIFIPIAWALGFATGNYLGIFLSQHFIGGHLTLNIVSAVMNETHIEILKLAGFGVSVLNSEDDKMIILVQIDKKRLKKLQDLLDEIDPNAFIIANETKYVHNGFIK